MKKENFPRACSNDILPSCSNNTREKEFVRVIKVSLLYESQPEKGRSARAQCFLLLRLNDCGRWRENHRSSTLLLFHFCLRDVLAVSRTKAVDTRQLISPFALGQWPRDGSHVWRNTDHLLSERDIARKPDTARQRTLGGRINGLS